MESTCYNMKNLTNTALIKACASRLENQKAWLEFLRRFDRHIKLSVLRAHRFFSISFLEKVIVKEDIKDLVQEVYIRLFKNDCKVLKNFKPKYENAIYAYLSIMCTSVVKDFFKKFGRLKRKGYLESIDERSDINKENKLINKSLSSFVRTNAEKQIIEKDLLEKIKSHYNSTNSKKDDKRKELIFQLYFVHGLSITDISRIKGLNISLSNANTIIWRMKRNIRSLVFNDSISPRGI